MTPFSEAHRGVNKFCNNIQQSTQARGQVNALGAGFDALVEDLDEVAQAVLVHGVYERQISHDKEQSGAPMRHSSVLLSGQIDLGFRVLRFLHSFLNNLCIRGIPLLFWLHESKMDACSTAPKMMSAP